MKKNSNISLTRPHLESLSTGELIDLADSFGIDIPQALERIFIIEELLERTNADAGEVKEDIEIKPSCSETAAETAALPKQYNISYIEVIIRDPLWAFVFWEIKNHEKEIHEKTDDFNGYCLRVIPSNKEETEFTVPIEKDDCARYLGFAEHSSQIQCSYIIKLCVIRGKEEIQIAVSAPFCLPRLIENENIHKMKEHPLACLSGVQDLTTTKCMDRQFRNKGQ